MTAEEFLMRWIQGELMSDASFGLAVKELEDMLIAAAAAEREACAEAAVKSGTCAAAVTPGIKGFCQTCVAVAAIRARGAK